MTPEITAAVAARRAERLEKFSIQLAERGIELIAGFRGVTMPATFRGRCGHYWRATAGSVLNSRHGCPVCAGRKAEYLKQIKSAPTL